MRDVKQLLQDLTMTFPVGPNHHHNVTVNNNGLLVVTVWMPFLSGFAPHTFILNDTDLDKPVETVVEEIKKLTPECR